MFKLSQNPNKNSFRRGVFFGLGVIVAGLSYAVVSLTIETKEDGAGDSTGRLTAAEFNQIPRILQGIRTDNGNFGIGINPTETDKLHVDGNILATGTITVNGDMKIDGEITSGGMITANNLRSKCEEGYVLQGFDQTTGDLVCVINGVQN